MLTEARWLEMFSEELVYILKDRHISQRDLADMSGLSYGAISNYINKTRIPNIKAIINISYALHVDPGELIDFGQRIV